MHAKRAILVRVDLQRSSHGTKESKTIIVVLIILVSLSYLKNIHNTIAIISLHVLEHMFGLPLDTIYSICLVYTYAFKFTEIF